VNFPFASIIVSPSRSNKTSVHTVFGSTVNTKDVKGPAGAAERLGVIEAGFAIYGILRGPAQLRVAEPRGSGLRSARAVRHPGGRDQDRARVAPVKLP